MDKHQIGVNAGKVWKLLNDNKRWSYCDLKRASELSDRDLNAAIGLSLIHIYQYMPPAMQAIKMIARITPWETLFFFSSEISCVSVVSSIFCSFSKSEVTGVITVFSDGVASSDAIVSKDVFSCLLYTSRCV